MNDMDDKLIQMLRASGAEQCNSAGTLFMVSVKDAVAYRSAILADAAKDVEPVAFMFQHSETGRVTFVDAWQKENGWSAGNPRFKEVGALYGASTLAAAQALNAELVARVEGLEKDAARYRHLRGHRGMEHDSFAVHSTLTDDLLWGDDLDHEIDRIAAIAARSGT